MPITFETISAVDNGAQFYTADLHVHSYSASADVRDPAMTPEAIVGAAVERSISILAITDHNNAANLQRAINAAAQYRGRLLLLAGVEVTTAHGHLLAYFAPEKVRAVQDLLGRIAVKGEPGARDSHTAMSMADVIAEVERLGGVSIAAHVDRTATGFEVAHAGYPNWKKDIITQSGLYGLEFDDAGHLDWYSPEESAASPAGAERRQLIRARASASTTLARPRLAPIQNSDAHSLEAFREQVGRRVLTRFKMDSLTFEGFRTALVDPEARVRAQSILPPAVPRILGMYFDGGFVSGETIQFSDNLTCLIGGRGAGKSTIVRSLAYGLGMDDEFEEHDNCPDDVVIYCEDASGVRYRYERQKGGSLDVRAKEDNAIRDVPADAFRIEFYRQGNLAEVAKDPLQQPALLQEFLDRHIPFGDLLAREGEILRALEENGAVLRPLEATASQVPGKRAALEDVKKKLTIAETGKVREIAGAQARLAAERTLLRSLDEVATLYEKSASMSAWRKDYAALTRDLGPLTGDAECAKQLDAARAAIHDANAFITTQEQAFGAGLKTFGQLIRAAVVAARRRHGQLEETLGASTERLRKQGLAGGIQELNILIKQQEQLSGEITRIAGQAEQLAQLRRDRADLLGDLETVRREQAERRKAQLETINDNLAQMIPDLTVVLHYDEAGIVEEFVGWLLGVMHGSYLPEEAAQRLCSAVTPGALACLVSSGDLEGVGRLGGIGEGWAAKLIERLGLIEHRHALEAIAKPPCPVIKVLTKSRPQKAIPVNQLSDGQKHTILLTIAMLAESNMPLVIDQPEDDLDNSFIFTSVVATLRRIKERRQVVVVTHNANIAVLGDSELLLPLKRSGDGGKVHERGSIDRRETCSLVQEILEGGSVAFQRRREIYGH